MNQPIKGVMVPKKSELPQERMNEAKKAHLVSQAGTWSWRSASSWQLRAFIQLESDWNNNQPKLVVMSVIKEGLFDI